MKDKKTCCICGKPFDGYGNNPAPVIDGKGYISHFATCPYANQHRRRGND